jgi:hypothetical protein
MLSFVDSDYIRFNSPVKKYVFLQNSQSIVSPQHKIRLSAGLAAATSRGKTLAHPIQKQK